MIRNGCRFPGIDDSAGELNVLAETLSLYVQVQGRGEFQEAMNPSSYLWRCGRQSLRSIGQRPLSREWQNDRAFRNSSRVPPR